MILGGIEYLASGSGEPVICLHGIGGHARSFAPQMADLQEHSVIAWLMPGYGASERNHWPPSFASLSETLHRFVTNLGHKRVHLVGHSIGGMLALEHAVRHPDQVATLSLIGMTPAFGGKDGSFETQFLKARLAPLERGHTMQEIAETASPQLVAPETNPNIIKCIVRDFAEVPETTWRGILKCLVTFDRRADLGRVFQPCCAIAGEHDENAPARTIERMATKLPNAEYHLIEGAGHMINQEAPDETNAILSNFLGRHPI